MKTGLKILAVFVLAALQGCVLIPPVFAGTNAGPWIGWSYNTDTGESADTRGVRMNISNQTVFGELMLTNTVWNDLRFPVFGLGRAGNADPAESFVQGPGADMIGLLFSASADQELFGSAQIDHSWKRGTLLRPHVHWTTTSTSTGAVVWGLDYSCAALGSNWTATASLLATNTWTNGVQWNSRLFSLGDMAPPPGATESFGIKFRVFRDANNGGDTYPDQAQLDDFDLHYEQEKLGTPDELSPP